MERTYDFLVIGGGIVGSSLAYGLSKDTSLDIAMVDAYDTTYRASVGNYGLAWLQSKGYKNPFYAQMTERSINLWKDFTKEIEEKSGIDIEYEQTGGFHFCFNKEEFDKRKEKMDLINTYYKNDETKTVMLNKEQTKELYPNLGDDVVGSSYNKFDGYLSPGKLLKAQIKLCKDQNVNLISNYCVISIRKENDIYAVISEDGRVLKAKQIVLAAGLSNKKLAKQLNVNVPIHPEKGHILVCQKVSNLKLIPSLDIRQSQDGTLLLGHSNEDRAYDLSIEEDVVQKIINNAVRILPMLKNINLIRSWSSLRIIPEDGKSIYDTIDKTLHIVSTHSAITFAPIHVNEVSKSILSGKMPDNLKDFSLSRFKEGANQ
jgi:glycine/D-amino acid oxidase-like deaminating enzyme